MASPLSPRFTTALAVEAYKLRRSLALLLAVVAPLPIAVFVFFNLLRMDKAMTWQMTLQSSAAIWAFFMLPMSVTALTALVAHTEHGPRTWDHLRALPLPRWHLYAAKAASVLGIVLLMSMALALMTWLAVQAAGWWKPTVAASGAPDIATYLLLLGRIFLAAWLLVAVQLWIALRYVNFVPALAAGIGGTFFAVVATSAKIGVFLPWQIPVNQLASDPSRAQLTLLLGFAGGCVALVAMTWQLSRREVL
ncbi:ABC transporter permease [Thermomonas sp.]|uniref:ABC transporter permease n=1 Tax=Thermomonas sp. TaxID=1971895 RepID=UPI0024883F8C|nr:ABC transporter permease [Thermomonas sp.]MDI1253076.1 ABC transporter permease [Thermomonas sp.]